MRKIIIMKFLILSSIVLFSCIKEQDLKGTYVPVNYKNNFDTIRLEDDGIYSRKVYDINGKLLLKMKGRWEHKNDIINFRPFFLNLDYDLVKFPEVIQDTLGGWSGNLHKNNGNLEFCVGHLSASLPNQNCYRKIAK
jgi:hypothetical protein